MRKMKALTAIWLTVFLLAGWLHASDDQYGLFLIDQSQSMNQPEYAPRFERALKETVKEIDAFVAETQALGQTPYFKIATFNAGTGYIERTPWTVNPEDAYDALAFLYEEEGFNASAAGTAVCEAGSDISMQALTKDQARIYVFSDQTASLKGFCDGATAWESPAFELLAKRAQWRVFLYEGLPAEQRPPRLNIQRVPGWETEKTTLNQAGVLENSGMTLLDLATLSGGMTIKVNDSLDFNDQASPCGLFEQDCIRNKNGMLKYWNYFSTGERSSNIKSIGSADASSWSGGQINVAAKSAKAISAVRFQDRTYIFYRGVTHPNMHYAYSSDHGVTWQGGGYVQTGGSSPTTVTTSTAPSALVVNGKIRLYFIQDNFTFGPIRYIDTTSVNGNGSLNWSSASVYTGLDTSSTMSRVSSVFDPTTNEELIIFSSRITSKMEIHGRSLSTPAAWVKKATLPSVTRSELEAVHNGTDLFIAFRGTNNSLYFMKRSANWAPFHVDLQSTFAKPGLAYLDGKFVILYHTVASKIKYVATTDGGLTWDTAVDAPETTHSGLELIAYEYTQPLVPSISQPYYGVIGSSYTWTASATGGTGPYTYSWTVDGFPAGSGPQLTRFFVEAGTYLIRLTVTDSNGNTQTTVRWFNVSDPNATCGPRQICDFD